MEQCRIAVSTRRLGQGYRFIALRYEKKEKPPDQVKVQSRRELSIKSAEKLQKLLVPVACLAFSITVPSSTFRAANKVVVPWRL